MCLIFWIAQDIRITTRVIRFNKDAVSKLKEAKPGKEVTSYNQSAVGCLEKNMADMEVAPEYDLPSKSSSAASAPERGAEALHSPMSVIGGDSFFKNPEDDGSRSLHTRSSDRQEPTGSPLSP